MHAENQKAGSSRFTGSLPLLRRGDQAVHRAGFWMLFCHLSSAASVSNKAGNAVPLRLGSKLKSRLRAWRIHQLPIPHPSYKPQASKMIARKRMASAGNWPMGRERSDVNSIETAEGCRTPAVCVAIAAGAQHFKVRSSGDRLMSQFSKTLPRRSARSPRRSVRKKVPSPPAEPTRANRPSS